MQTLTLHESVAALRREQTFAASIEEPTVKCIHPGCDETGEDNLSFCIICKKSMCHAHDCTCPVLDMEFYFNFQG